MTLLDQALGLHAGLKTLEQAPQQAVSNTYIEVATELEGLAAAVEAALPNAVINAASIKKNGLAVSGKPAVPFAVTQKRPTKASVTVYANGTVVWSGLEPVYPAAKAA